MSIHEECGVFGVIGPEPTDVASISYYGLYALQHRGQESCGTVVNDDGVFVSHKDLGLVSEVFSGDILSRLPKGTMAVAHARYGTTGGTNRNNCQPIEVNHQKGRMALAHNGNLSNAAELRNELELTGAIFHTTSDTETIAYIITKERLKAPSIEDAVSQAMNTLDGAYSLVLMSPQKLICARDPYGFRPLCFGKRADGMYVVASESCAIKAVGAEVIRDVEPGEILVFSKNGVASRREHCGKKDKKLCVFEYIYFARPDSTIDGVCVNMARQHAGRLLAKEHPVEADLVCGVPDCAIEAAIGYSAESGIPLVTGLVKNKYIGRAFNNRKRNEEYLLRIKLNALRANVEGKRVIIIDDSILRGYTSKHIVELLRKAGAKEVHMRISSPPFKNPCYFLSDTNGRETLISARYTTEELCQAIGADSLGFLSLDGVKEIAKDCKLNVCDACFSGNYCIDIPENISVMRTDKYAKKIEE